jgi:hypothetical protein
MWKVTCLHGRGEPHASIQEVEPVEHAGKTLYRDVMSGRVDCIYEFMHERVFDDRDTAVAFAAGRLRMMVSEFSTQCERLIESLREEAVAS